MPTKAMGGQLNRAKYLLKGVLYLLIFNLLIEGSNKSSGPPYGVHHEKEKKKQKLNKSLFKNEFEKINKVLLADTYICTHNLCQLIKIYFDLAFDYSKC